MCLAHCRIRPVIMMAIRKFPSRSMSLFILFSLFVTKEAHIIVAVRNITMYQMVYLTPTIISCGVFHTVNENRILYPKRNIVAIHNFLFC